VKTNKSGCIDAEAIAEAVGRPMRFVPTKTDDQLDLQSPHRVLIMMGQHSRFEALFYTSAWKIRFSDISSAISPPFVAETGADSTICRSRVWRWAFCCRLQHLHLR
jgi:hypothetical protein